jgi:hypothetical protein
MEDGSAANCATTGARGGGGAGGGGAGAAGGGGGGGTFFLQPTPNTTKLSAMQMIVIFRLLNMNLAS